MGTASHEAAAGGTFRTPVAAIDAIVVSLSLFGYEFLRKSIIEEKNLREL